MDSNYSNQSKAFGGQSASKPAPTSLREKEDWPLYYGRDHGSMRGNDYYGTQSFANDYARGQFSASTFGGGGKEKRQNASREVEYEEFPDYSNRPTYGSFAGSRAYTNFMDYNYGYAREGKGAATYNTRDKDRASNVLGSRPALQEERPRFRSPNQRMYSENDGRRR
ncbi:hypothetical protein [Pontibacter mangrovi]|uniref:Uncharacterized protein n=1 Tax=Pontibacter mangrovi TaxID=2589816 RepID=A0A501WL55_9BACT|nr:hypothetical protein [Pontibacter mangrovi]TPE46386.1 hypothetical protein FJM65_03325 [Pontibacter mangrovi]